MFSKAIAAEPLVDSCVLAPPLCAHTWAYTQLAGSCVSKTLSLLVPAAKRQDYECPGREANCNSWSWACFIIISFFSSFPTSTSVAKDFL